MGARLCLISSTRPSPDTRKVESAEAATDVTPGPPAEPRWTTFPCPLFFCCLAFLAWSGENSPLGSRPNTTTSMTKSLFFSFSLVDNQHHGIANTASQLN